MTGEHGRRLCRVGIDVGGTFAKAVLIDNEMHDVVGRFSVLTTHADPRGVAAGVVAVFRNVLEQSGVDPADVIFLAHDAGGCADPLEIRRDASAARTLALAGVHPCSVRDRRRKLRSGIARPRPPSGLARQAGAVPVSALRHARRLARERTACVNPAPVRLWPQP